MTIDRNPITDYPDFVNRLLKAVEGAAKLSPEVILGNDHTITFGYGYTFVRGPRPYVHLSADLAPLGIVLSTDQTDLIAEIATNREGQLGLDEADRNWTVTDNLIQQFNNGWQYADITEAQATDLLTVELGHLSDRLQDRIRGHLRGLETPEDIEDLIESTEGFKFSPTEMGRAVFQDIDLADCPPILGYNQTIRIPESNVLLEFKETGDPALIIRRIGRGNVLAYTSDPAPHWACNFVYWEQYGAFWRKCLQLILDD